MAIGKSFFVDLLQKSGQPDKCHAADCWSNISLSDSVMGWRYLAGMFPLYGPGSPPTPGPWCHLHDPAIPGRVGHLWPLLPSGLKIWCWVVVKKSRNNLFNGCHLWRKKKNSANQVHGIDSSCEPMFLFKDFPLGLQQKAGHFLYPVPHPTPRKDSSFPSSFQIYTDPRPCWRKKH